MKYSTLALYLPYVQGLFTMTYNKNSHCANVLDSENKDQWVNAMNDEIESLKAHGVWELVEPLKDSKIVGSKWVFKAKRDVNGEFERCKAQLVAQGCSQHFGQDYDETFSTVVRFESVRLLLALMVQCHLKLHQMDVKTAFLSGELKEDIYKKQPEGYIENTWFAN